MKPQSHSLLDLHQDTGDFINKLEATQLEENDMLVTIDVSALYTSIPHEEGLSAIHDWMIYNQVDAAKVRDLARMVLTKNNFKFNNKTYSQVQGTAIGTRMAPNYAIIFMHMLETSLLNNYPLQPKL